ncbi:hypothetical protein TD95_003301 [Thielaviopsis punctulata]|uniref:Peptidase S8/S53 domain-containing protein n=1 Tax=Thielaviopsis punctulata TaxID=72032 RepID=A0A0F4ZCN4_9PEZI|nr:hypothetical protein TD95_003301 [Thielaviopsis punctulata]
MQSFLTSGLALLSLGGLAAARHGQTMSTDTGAVIPGAYFIELHKDASSLSSRSAPVTFAERVKRDEGISVSVRHSFVSSTGEDLFHGISANVASGDVPKLQALPEVKRIFPVRLVSRPKTLSAEYSDGPLKNGSTRNEIVIPEVSANLHVDVSAKKTPVNQSSNSSAFDWNWLHKVTGVDKVHAKGIYGKGVKLAVIDTGVDYLHPALGGCFGPGCRVSFGYDLVGNNYGNTSFVPEPSDTPLATCYSGFHGTHVSGSIIMEVGKDSPFFVGLIGAAPEVTYGMYRVYGCTGFAGDDVILSAMSRAADDGAHVISMSLGEWAPIGDYYFSAFPDAVRSLKARGIAVIAAGGNDGAYSPFFLDIPGISPDAMSVASVENTHFATYSLTTSYGAKIQYGALYPFPHGTYKVYVLEFQESKPYAAFGCSSSDYPTPDQLDGDISEYLIIMRRGLCTITSAQSAAASAGFSQVIIYPDPDNLSPFIDGYAVPTPAITNNHTVYNFGSFSREDGFNLVKKYNETGSMNISIESDLPTLLVQPGGAKPNNFSSCGPTMDFKLKPQISSPGGMILSTFPTSGDGIGFGIISGTSMATPYLSSVYALVKSHNPDMSVDEIFDIIKATATPIDMFDYDSVSPAPQQGAGLVNAEAAVFHKTTVSPAEINAPWTSKLNSTNIVLTINNPSSSDVTYSLSNFPAAGMAMYPQGEEWPDESGFLNSLFYRLEAMSFHSGLDFICPDGSSCSSVTVSGGKSAQITVKIEVDEQPADIIPIYSGFVNITSSLGEVLTVPYVGPAYDYGSAAMYGLKTPNKASLLDVWSNERSLYTEPQVYITSTRADMGQYHVFNYSGSNSPTLISSTLQPLQWLKIDLVRWNTSIVPTYYGYNRSYVYPPLTNPFMKDNGTDGAGPVIGLMYQQNGPGPHFAVNSPLSTFVSDTAGTLSLGLYEGSYRIILQGLKFGYNVSDLDAWETWLGPVFDIPVNVTVV